MVLFMPPGTHIPTFILDINPGVELLVINVLNISSYSVICFYILLVISFDKQKLILSSYKMYQSFHPV